MAEIEAFNAQINRYNSAQLVCLIGGVGVCMAFLPCMPVGQDISPSSWWLITYVVSRLSLILAMSISILISSWFIWNKEKNHRQHVVLWPHRCRHCAKVLGLRNNHASSPNGDRITHAACRLSTSDAMPDVEGSLSHALPQTGILEPLIPERSQPIASQDLCSEQLRVNSSPTSTSASREARSEVKSLSDQSIGNDTDVSNSGSTVRGGVEEYSPYLSERPTRSISNEPFINHSHKSMFYVLNTFTALTVIQVITNLTKMGLCLSQNHSHLTPFIWTAVIDVWYLVSVMTHSLFLRHYHDATFIDNGFILRALGFTLGTLFWAAVRQFTEPIRDIIKEHRFPLTVDCNLNATVGSVLTYVDDLLDPVSEEWTIIGTAIALQMWTSVLPRSVITVSTADIELTQSVSLGDRKSDRYLHSSLEDNTKANLQRVRRYTFGIGLLSALIHTVLVVFVSLSDITKYQQLYIQFSCDIVLCPPLVLLCYHQSSVTKSFSRFRLKKTVSAVHGGLIRGEDVLMLFCSCGLAMLSIFKIVASIGLLATTGTRPRDRDALCSCEIARSSLAVVNVFAVTFSLFKMQRRHLEGFGERKWTLMCLIYVAVASATKWIEGNVANDTWPLLREYFGDNSGNVIGALLFPIVTLYSLHAAMMAYEIQSTL